MPEPRYLGELVNDGMKSITTGHTTLRWFPDSCLSSFCFVTSAPSVGLRCSCSHFLTQPAHHPCKRSVPAQIHATVRTGSSVSTWTTARRGLSPVCRPARPFDSSAVGVVGSSRVLNAMRDVCTPTMEVYRAKGKNGTAACGVSGCLAAGAVAAACAFDFRAGIVQRAQAGRWYTGGVGGRRQSTAATDATRTRCARLARLFSMLLSFLPSPSTSTMAASVYMREKRAPSYPLLVNVVQHRLVLRVISVKSV